MSTGEIPSTGAAGQPTLHPNPHDTVTTSSSTPHLSDETERVRTFLRDLTTPEFNWRFSADETSREFPLSRASWCELKIEPFVESLRNRYVVLYVKFSPHSYPNVNILRSNVKIAYDAFRSVLTVFPMPSRIHSVLQRWVYDVATRR